MTPPTTKGKYYKFEYIRTNLKEKQKIRDEGHIIQPMPNTNNKTRSVNPAL